MAGYVSGNESLKVATLDVPLDEASLNAHLGLAYAPDPDLLIRTGRRVPHQQLHVVAACVY